jgi:hypothetical protein
MRRFEKDHPSMPSPLPVRITAVAAMLALAACGGGDAAPPKDAEGATGVTPSENASASQDPAASSLSGGPSGQGPAYGQPGGSPSAVVSSGDGAGPSVGNDNSPSGGESRGADAGSRSGAK